MKNRKRFRTSVFGIVFIVIIFIVIVFSTWKLIQNWDEKSSLKFLRNIVFMIPFLLWFFFMCTARVELYDDHMIVVTRIDGGFFNKKVTIFYKDIYAALGKVVFLSENSFRIRLKDEGQEVYIGSIRKYQDLLEELKNKGINVIEKNK